jgi:hypothetical protein
VARSRSRGKIAGPVTFALDLNNQGQIVGFGVDLADLTSVRSFLLAKGAQGTPHPDRLPGRARDRGRRPERRRPDRRLLPEPRRHPDGQVTLTP